jgi:hypothetical protein
MNPDVFITIAFVGIVFLALIVSLIVVLPQVRRESAGLQQSESSPRSKPPDATLAEAHDAARDGVRSPLA